MDDRWTRARTSNFSSATICFMQMNDERIFHAFILQFRSSVGRLHSNETTTID